MNIFPDDAIIVLPSKKGEDKKMALNTAFCSSLRKIYKSTVLADDSGCLSLLSGEKGNFQLAFRSDRDTTVTVTTDCPFAEIYLVKEIYASYAIDKEECGDILLENNGDPGYYPDLLDIFDGNLTLKKDETAALWINADTTGITPGTYNINFTVTENGSSTVNTPSSSE